MLKLLRQNAGLTQCAAAGALGVGQSAIAMWETGKNHPRAKRIPDIAALYGASIEEVIRASCDNDGGDRNDAVSENPGSV